MYDWDMKRTLVKDGDGGGGRGAVKVVRGTRWGPGGAGGQKLFKIPVRIPSPTASLGEWNRTQVTREDKEYQLGGRGGESRVSTSASAWE